MDRLSAYAQREAEAESPEQRKKTESESIANLLEQLRIAKEKAPAEPEQPTAQQNGDAPEEARSGVEEGSVAPPANPEPEETDAVVEKSRGIPKNIRLFEIFYEQVTSLVKMQRLGIQDTIGLLVSLANLAL
jgi:vacuolar protein sorting-associated protein 35